MTWDAPGSADEAYMRQARFMIDGILVDFDALFEGVIAEFCDPTGSAGIQPLPERDGLHLH